MRIQYGAMRPHLCQHLSDFDGLFCLSLVRVPESRVNRGSGFLGVGRFIQSKEGCGLQKPQAV